MRKRQIQAGIVDFFSLPKRKSQYTFWLAKRLPYWLMAILYSLVGLLNSPVTWGFITALIFGFALYFYKTAK